MRVLAPLNEGSERLRGRMGRLGGRNCWYTLAVIQKVACSPLCRGDEKKVSRLHHAGWLIVIRAGSLPRTGPGHHHTTTNYTNFPPVYREHH